MSRLIDSTGRPVTPTPPELVDVVQLEQVTGLLTGLDLRYGGGLVSQLSKALLRWAVVMLDAANMADPVPARLSAAVSALAARAGWAAFDVAAHEAARLAAGQLKPAAGHTRQVLAATEQIRSARLAYAIIAIRAAAARHPDTADAGQLIEEIDAGIEAPDAEPANGQE